MESSFRCASRSDAGTPTTAFDLCKLAANIQTSSLNVCRNDAENAVGQILIFRVGIFLHVLMLHGLVEKPLDFRNSHSDRC